VQWERLADACEKEGIPESSYVLQRFVLLATGATNLPLIPRLPVVEEVKTRLLDQFLYVVLPTRRWRQLLNRGITGSASCASSCGWSVFPPASLTGSLSGFPPLMAGKNAPTRHPGAVNCVFLRAGGSRPFFETHTAFRREAPILTEADERKVFRLLGGSMRLQPEIRGIWARSWFLDPMLAKVSPHIGWLAEWFEECERFGAVWTTIGKASPIADFSSETGTVATLRNRALETANGLIIWERATCCAGSISSTSRSCLGWALKKYE